MLALRYVYVLALVVWLGGMVILGGLVASTLLNLFVVPSLYLRFARNGRNAEPVHLIPAAATA